MMGKSVHKRGLFVIMNSFNFLQSVFILYTLLLLGVVATSHNFHDGTATQPIITVAPDVNDTMCKMKATESNSTVVDKCVAFYNNYVNNSGAYVNCELRHSRPFRVCSNCVEEYAIASATFSSLFKHKDLRHCRDVYVKGDRVQILPSMNIYMNEIWEDASCTACTENVVIDNCTGKVNFTIPIEIVQFLDLFQNLSTCMNISLEEGNIKLWDYDFNWINASVCTNCLKEYKEVNNHYISMSDRKDGDLCMDIVDRMNYTRLIWSHRFHCSCRETEPPPVIVITFLILILPLSFYITSRFKCKGKKTRVFKQKRLSSLCTSVSTSSYMQSQSGFSL